MTISAADRAVDRSSPDNGTTGLYGVNNSGLTDARHTIKLTVVGTKVAVDRFVAA
jgi:hypothetical protein